METCASNQKEIHDTLAYSCESLFKDNLNLTFCLFDLDCLSTLMTLTQFLSLVC